MPPTNTPTPWMVFLVMFVAVGGAVGLIVLLGGLSRMARGESFWPGEPRERPSAARSPSRAMRVRGGSGVRGGAPGSNAALRQQNGTFAGSLGSRSGSEVRESSDQPAPIAADLPQTIEELIWTIEAVRLRTSGECATKEAAILRAFPHVQSKGAGSWQRASRLYDTVMQAQRAAPTPTPSTVAETA